VEEAQEEVEDREEEEVVEEVDQEEEVLEIRIDLTQQNGDLLPSLVD